MRRTEHKQFLYQVHYSDQTLKYRDMPTTYTIKGKEKSKNPVNRGFYPLVIEISLLH